jgi:hypothetical protein
VGLRLPGTIQPALHTVVQGRAWLWIEDPGAALGLAPGDLPLVPGGPDHHIAHQRVRPASHPSASVNSIPMTRTSTAEHGHLISVREQAGATVSR